MTETEKITTKENEKKSDMMSVTKKIFLFPRGDKEEIGRVYDYIRNGQEVQALCMNRYITALYAAKERKASKEELGELGRVYSRVPSSGNLKESPYKDIKKNRFPKGIAMPGCVPTLVKPKLKKAYEDGLKYGRVSLPTFKASNPLYVQGALLFPFNDSRRIKRGSIAGLNTGYNTVEDLLNALDTEKHPDLYITFTNGIIFDLDLGNIYKTKELRATLKKIFTGEYSVGDSSIQLEKYKDKQDGKEKTRIRLNLSVSIPKEKRVLDKNTVVGVDLGCVVPAMCALNNNLYKRESIGSYDDMLAYKAKKKQMYISMKSKLKLNSGGHGRTKKLKHLESYGNYVSNYSKQYNHKVSKAIINFALRNNAAYINLEDLAGIKKNREDDYVLKNWSLYDLVQKIKYKAEQNGIEVRFVSPKYTSQTCSVCGKKGIRPDQKTFICTNPECKCKDIYSHTGGNTMKNHFADFNAARNISMMTEFVVEGENSDKTKAGKEKKKNEYIAKMKAISEAV